MDDCEFENNFVLVDEVECVFYDQTFTTTPFSWLCSFTKVMNKFANTLAHTQTLFATPSMIFHKPNKQTKYTTVNIYIKCEHVKGSMNLTNISVKGNYYFVHKLMINWLNSS